jgi:hypothetical protein
MLHLSPSERGFLLCLGRKRIHRYADCRGRTLDVLICKGLALYIDHLGEVWLTEEGCNAAAELRRQSNVAK